MAPGELDDLVEVEGDLSRDPDDDLLTAGQVVPPGRYQRIDTAAARIIVLDRRPGSSS